MRDWTHIAVVLDRSGSMSGIKRQTADSLDEFINKQKDVGGNASVTLAQFDDQYDIVWKDKDLSETTSVSRFYRPRGLTALLDAIGKTINSVGASLAAKPDDEKPDKVIFVILTDGLENASKEYTREKIFDMIRHQEEKYGWEFVFLGANQDAIGVGMELGIKMGSAATYDTTKVDCAIEAVHNTVRKYRGMNKMQRQAVTSGSIELFSDDDRKSIV
jgi:electron transfer flavoprotein alpha subunit